VEEQRQNNIILPPKYYLTYFEYLLRFVEIKYGEILLENEWKFLREFNNLKEDSRCLYVRLINRRGRFFKVSSLAYEEIVELEDSLEELTGNGFFQEVVEADPALFEELLWMFTKPELLAIAQLLDRDLCPPASTKKPDLVRWLHHSYDFEKVLSCIEEKIIMPVRQTEVLMIKFLFFGNRHDDMSEFVIRDLGHVRFQNFDDDQLSVQFKSRKEADDCYMISLQAEYFENCKKEIPAEEIYDWFMNWQIGTSDHLSIVARPAFDRLVIKVATYLERSRLWDQALSVFQLTEQPPARERRTRLLYRMGFVEESAALSKLMLTEPQNSDEKYFGNDFLEKISSKKKKTIKSTTRLLKQSDTLDIAVTYRYQVERGVINYYLEKGYQAVFSENEPWRAIFGLLFWDIIYDTNVKAIHHPLQRVPSDFFQPDFYLRRRDQLEERLSMMKSNQDLVQYILDVWNTKTGITNVMVSWYEEVLFGALTIGEMIPLPQLGKILMEMAMNLRENARGFPDLLVWKDQEYVLVEVKSPTDHLSARQLRWQEVFASLNINCKVVRVAWIETVNSGDPS